MAIAILLPVGVSAQVQDLGIKPLTMGTDFRAVVPKVRASPTEKPLPQPVSLFISSSYQTRVRITSGGDTRIDREVALHAGEVYKFSLPLPLMLEQSSTTSDDVIRVTSERPIAVSVFLAWNGNGEMMQITPTHSLGDEYRTANTFLDGVKLNTGAYLEGQPMAIVVGVADSTEVEIRTNNVLDDGPDVELVQAGLYRVRLDNNEAVLLTWKFDKEILRTWESDPSGSLITSNKPIGVYSGATKNAIMRMPDSLPPESWRARPAYMVRNSLFESTPPRSVSGSEFVTVPVLYTTTRVPSGPKPEHGIDNDSGDVIRVLAFTDGTTVRKRKATTDVWQLVATLNAGESYRDTSASDAFFWSTSSPCQVWQYGKSYAKDLTSLVENTKSDGIQAHPVVEAGMPMLMNVPALSRNVSHGVFHSPEGMDNFMNIVFKEDDINRIMFDGESLATVFGNNVHSVVGTDLAYIRTAVSAGDHVIESQFSPTRWIAWTYGSLDGLALGRSYGMPVAMNYATDHRDSVSISRDHPDTCIGMSGSAVTIAADGYDASISMVYLSASNNCELNELVNAPDSSSWSLEVDDLSIDATSEITIVMSNGRRYLVRDTIVGLSATSDPEGYDFGTIELGTTECVEINVTNTSSVKLNVTDIVTNFPSVNSVSPKQFSLEPGATQTLELCATKDDPSLIVDTLRVLSKCVEVVDMEIRVRATAPKIYVSDYNWNNVDALGGPVTATLRIVNGGNVQVRVDSSTVTPEGIFDVEQLSYPLVIETGEEVEFDVTYTPDGREHSVLEAYILIHSNARIVDTVGIVRIDRVTSVDEDEHYSANGITISPHPIIVGSGKPARVKLPRNGLTIELYDIEGRLVWSTSEAPLIMTIPENVFTHSGAFVLIAKDARGSIQQTITVVE